MNQLETNRKEKETELMNLIITRQILQQNDLERVNDMLEKINETTSPRKNVYQLENKPNIETKELDSFNISAQEILDTCEVLQ